MLPFACAALLATSSVQFREEGLRAAETKGDFPRLTSVLVVEGSPQLACAAR